MPAYYCTQVSALCLDDKQLIADLVRGYEADKYAELKVAQLAAWTTQIAVLRKLFQQLPDSGNWGLLLEFTIPRRMSRADAILLIGQAIVVLEFKTERMDVASAEQAEDYALDLAQFHRPSHDARIYPIVVGTERTIRRPRTRISTFPDIESTVLTSYHALPAIIAEIAAQHSREEQRAVETWNSGDYYPVPTIVEAALGLFRNMHVDEIAHSDADPINLGRTVECLRNIVCKTKRSAEGSKAICFLTGVPGAGKTLAGLKLVHDSSIRAETDSHIAFLSGNDPLVAVLRGALTKDLRLRAGVRRREAIRDPKTLIQPVYEVKKDLWLKKAPPAEHVWVFDEAQRAWDQKRTAKKLPPKEDQPCPYSEPALLLSFLDRHDWAVLVCLIGGGQEIHTGEAGLSEWGRAIHDYFPHWNVFASPSALQGLTGAGQKLFADRDHANLQVFPEPDLHLDIPTRQFRGKTVSTWVEAVLEGDCDSALRVLRANPEYPVLLSRSLNDVKSFLRRQALGTERFGLLCSSGAKRLRAEGITVSSARSGDEENWFLANRGDIRSSFQLEVAATEFQVQGLEIDWAAVCWGGDFTWAEGGWVLRELSGPRWLNLRTTNAAARSYLFNTYRVLLTRARQGMVLYVPKGSDEDTTRNPAWFDRTYDFLVNCGARPL